MSVFDVLQERGFIKQMSHETEIKELLEKEKNGHSSYDNLTIDEGSIIMRDQYSSVILSK